MKRRRQIFLFSFIAILTASNLVSTKSFALIDPGFPPAKLSVLVGCVGLIAFLAAAPVPDTPDNPLAFKSKAKYEAAVQWANERKQMRPFLLWGGGVVTLIGIGGLVIRERDLRRKSDWLYRNSSAK